MNKTELIAAVAEKASISKKESEAVINAALETIIDSLKNDEKVQLVGFGSFETKHRAERTGRNPKTKESITIAASKVPAFKEALSSPASPARSTSSRRRRASCVPPWKTAQTTKKNWATCCSPPSRPGASAASIPRRR